MGKPTASNPIIAQWSQKNYGLDLQKITQLNTGLDPNAAVYRLETAHQSYFLKVHSGPASLAGLWVPHLLQKNGVHKVLAPIETFSGELESALGEYSAVLYPFIEGKSAVEVGLSQSQWAGFGRILKQIQSPLIANQVAHFLPREGFNLPSLEPVVQIDQALDDLETASQAQQKLAEFWLQNRAFIHQIGSRAKALGQELQKQTFDFVLCHSDIHAANIMVSAENLVLVDWDTPLLAPPERDLLFVVGSTIARRVLPHEEAWFFEGYGPHKLNLEALAYFRYERAIQDIGAFAHSVLLEPNRPEADRLEEARLFIQLFDRGDIIQAALNLDPGA